MKDIYVKDLQVGEEINDIFMVKNSGIKSGSNNKNYFDLTIGDKTGEINGKKWNIADEEENKLSTIKAGDIIEIKAIVKEWNGSNQLNISKIIQNPSQDAYDINDFVKSAPERPEDMYEYIYAKAEAFGDEDLKKICIKILADNKEKLMYYPAASKNHHAEKSGLLWHIKQMLSAAEKMCEVYTFLNKDLLMAGVIVHDIEKIREIKSDINGISSGYTTQGNMLGHLTLGVREMEKLCIELGVGIEKALMLEHMIISHHYEPEWGSPIRPAFPEAEMLHYLDIIDARLYDMQEALQPVNPGEFSDKVWTLDNRRLYKPVCYGKESEINQDKEFEA